MNEGAHLGPWPTRVRHRLPPQLPAHRDMPISALEGLGIAGTLTDCTAVFSAEDHAAAARADDPRSAGDEGRRDPARTTSTSTCMTSPKARRLPDARHHHRHLLRHVHPASLMLIAMTNVFNTLTNGLILRKREFADHAVDRQGARDFRKMTACECIGFGVRGLIPASSSRRACLSAVPLVRGNHRRTHVQPALRPHRPRGSDGARRHGGKRRLRPRRCQPTASRTL